MLATTSQIATLMLPPIIALRPSQGMTRENAQSDAGHR